MKVRKSSQNTEGPQERIFIGVAGGSAAGKTTLCETINRQMAFDRNFKVQTISLDSFYKSIDKSQVDVAQYNFDHPLALDFDLAFEVLNTLKHTNEPVAIPQYSFVEHMRLPQCTYINPANIILFEGLMAFHDERIRNLMTYKIFINCDDDIRLCRRIKRDTAERGRTIVGVLKQYNKFVKNAFRDFIYPTITYADLVIPGQRNNRISVDFIVQHIKNMAKKINIFEKASKTKVFLFGENEYYDRNVSKNYKTSVTHMQESFLIFPTSDEHRREIDFFMSTLMSEAFTQDYFEEVYIYQFMKIVRSLLRQLFELKSMNRKDVELISYFEVREKLSAASRRNTKIIFVPFILSPNTENILSIIKDLAHPSQTIIIVNLFCDMRFPNEVYNCETSGLMFLNLLLIANKRRLLEVLTSNNTNNKTSMNYDWLFGNSHLIHKGLHFVSNQLGIVYEPLSWKDYQSLLESDVDSKERKFHSYPIREDKIWNEDGKGEIRQISILSQKHENLCGFHALQVIREYPDLQLLRSEENFVRNYFAFNEALIKDEKSEWMKKGLFNPLERDSALSIIRNELLFEDKEISTLFLSENYIISQPRDLQDLSQRIDLLKHNLIDELFVLMGVYSHFFVLRLSKEGQIHYLDSLNTPIEEIMLNQVTSPDPTAQDHAKIRNLKVALNVIREILHQETSIQTILVRLRIDEVIGSFQEAGKAGRIEKWVAEEYPPPVIKNDLLNELRKVSGQDLGESYMVRVRKWLKDDFVKSKILTSETCDQILNDLSQ